MASAREAIARMRVPQPKGIARPPGPPAMKSMIALMTGRTPPYLFFQGISDNYQPVGYVHMAREHIYVLSSPELIWEAFVSQGRNMYKGRGVQLTRALLGNGLLASEGAQHLRNRRLVQPAFHRQAIAGYATDMVNSTKDLSDRWRQLTQSGNHEIDVVQEMSGVTLDIVGRSLFGADLTGDATQVAESLNVMLNGFNRISGPMIPALTRIPTPKRKRMIAAIDTLDNVVDGLIAKKHVEIAEGTAGHDVASLLLQTVDEETGATLSDQEVRDETMTMVLAGHETTAMTLSWTLRDLTMNPAQMAWLREELDALPDRDLTMTDARDLPRAYAIVAESIRLHPPAWFIGRFAAADLELGGWQIPQGSVLGISQYAMHRDARFWSQPLDFVPSRWLKDGVFDEKAPGQPRGSWFPFGFGTRRCIGEQFAWLEAVLVLATLLRQWNIQVIEPEAVVPMSAITMRPRDGMTAKITRRDYSPPV